MLARADGGIVIAGGHPACGKGCRGTGAGKKARIRLGSVTNAAAAAGRATAAITCGPLTASHVLVLRPTTRISATPAEACTAAAINTGVRQCSGFEVTCCRAQSDA